MVGPFPTWKLEPIAVSDVPFVLDTWCADELVNVGRDEDTDPEVFKVEQRERIMRLLSTCRGAVVRPEGDPQGILGYAVYSLHRRTLLPVVHFVYVKGAHRRQGIAQALLGAAGVRDKGGWVTHTRRRLREPLKRRGLLFNKYLLDFDPNARTR